MRNFIIVVVLSVLLATIFHLVTNRGVDREEVPRVSRTAGERFQPGDVAVVVVDFADLRDGDKTIARLGRECRISIEQVSGNWVGGTVQSGGKTLTGFVDEQYIDLFAGDTKVAAAANKSTTTGDTLANQFAGMVAAERTQARALDRGTTSDRGTTADEQSEHTEHVLPDAETTPVVTPVGVHVIVARTPGDLEQLQTLNLIQRLIVTGEQFSNESLQALDGLRILSLSIESANIGNAGLQHVRQVKNLRQLRLWTPGITDSGLEFLGALSELESLDLEGTSVQGESLIRLRDLTKLSHVTLGPKTADHDLDALQSLVHLSELDLRACYQLTEASLASIAKISQLRFIWLPDRLLAAGSAQLELNLPNCQIRNRVGEESKSEMKPTAAASSRRP